MRPRLAGPLPSARLAHRQMQRYRGGTAVGEAGMEEEWKRQEMRDVLAGVAAYLVALVLVGALMWWSAG